jgi:membrane associated rhomboid family serine protease
VRQPPSLSQLPRYPVSGGVCVLAIAVVIADTLKVDVSPLYMSYLAFWREPWRLISCVLPHANPIHLAGNLYWIWVLGTYIEDEFGSLRAATLMLVVGVGSSAAEYAFDVGGIGLSGVAYGLFGFLWVASRLAPRLRDAMDLRTVQLFIVWFFFCIFLTRTHVLLIGNVAHGVGLLFGAIAACVVAPKRAIRAAGCAALAIGLITTCCAASVWRPLVNSNPEAHIELEQAGIDALDKGDNQRAVALLQVATRYRGAEGRTWYNLAVAFEGLQRQAQAEKAFATSVRLDPSGTSDRGGSLNALANYASRRGKHERAIELYQRAIHAGNDDAAAWLSLGSELESVGRSQEAADQSKAPTTAPGDTQNTGPQDQ